MSDLKLKGNNRLDNIPFDGQNSKEKIYQAIN